MKRTTYIIFGMLLAGLVVICGGVFYASMNTTKWEDSFVNVDGEMKTVQLPQCKVVRLVLNKEIVERNDPLDGSIRIMRNVSFSNVPLTVCPTTDATASFSYASDMDKYMKMNTVGDTLRIVFDFWGDEEIKKKMKHLYYFNIRSAAMTLALPDGVQKVASNLGCEKTVLKDFDRDTLAFAISNQVEVENCRINTLYAHNGNINFRSGEVKDLHLYLDNIRNWNVNSETFHIDTEYLYATTNNKKCKLEKGEARQVIWKPLSEKASLNIELKEAARIVVE